MHIKIIPQKKKYQKIERNKKEKKEGKKNFPLSSSCQKEHRSPDIQKGIIPERTIPLPLSNIVVHGQTINF